MAGNVLEWVEDWYSASYYAQSPDRNPTGPATGVRKVLRSSGWLNPPFIAHAASRAHEAPESTANTIGFRCAKDTP